MKGVVRTVAEARELAAAEPKRWKAAVVYDCAAPQTLQAKVRLFATTKGAEETFRTLVKIHERVGYKRLYGGIGAGAIKMQRGEEIFCAYVQKRSKPSADVDA